MQLSDGYEMPPKENDRLTKEQIQNLEVWIAVGAPWPSDDVIAEFRKQAWGERVTKEGMLVETSGGLSESGPIDDIKQKISGPFQPVNKSKKYP